MPQPMRTPTRLDYGDDGVFHVSAFDFDLILIFIDFVEGGRLAN